jgi:hypothetical protein
LTGVNEEIGEMSAGIGSNNGDSGSGLAVILAGTALSIGAEGGGID